MGVTLATLPENRLPPNPPRPPPPAPGTAAAVPMGGGPCVGPPPPPRPPPAASLANVSSTSISVFFGNDLVRGMKTALRVRSTRYVPGRNALLAPYASRSTKSVASTSTRPLVSAATVNPKSTDFAKESSTDLRSAGFGLDERKDSLRWIIRILGPMRWNETIRPPPVWPRSSPMSFDPRPAAKPRL